MIVTADHLAIPYFAACMPGDVVEPPAGTHTADIIQAAISADYSRIIALELAEVVPAAETLGIDIIDEFVWHDAAKYFSYDGTKYRARDNPIIQARYPATYLPEELGIRVAASAEYMYRAVAVGNTRLVRYLNARVPVTQNLLHVAFDHGHIACAKYIHGTGVQPTKLMVTSAAAEGRLNSLRYLFDEAIDIPTEAGEAAAAAGRLDIIRFLYDQRIKFSWTAMVAAAAAGHLAIVKILVRAKCVYDERALASAAAAGHLTVVQYLHANGAALTKRIICNAAIAGHLPVVQYLHHMDDQWSAVASREASAPVAAWLRENLAPLPERILSQELRAPSKQSTTCLQLLQSNKILCNKT